MTLILGILGPAGSGKSTIASYLVEKYGAKEYMLAYPLKKLCRTAFPEMPKCCFWGTQAEKETKNEAVGFSGRNLMNRIGQGVRDAWGADFWVQDVLRQIARESPDVAVISDVRYVNEAELIGALGPVWRISKKSRATSTDGSHPSESEWKTARFTDPLDNNGTIERLHAEVDLLCRKYIIFPRRESLSW